MITTGIETITPETAMEWLATSLGNPRYGRSMKVNERQVNKMATDMTLGRWEVTNQSIAFDKDGHLIDGHTRLNAVIKSGKTIQSLVVRGLDNVAERYIDTGANRTLSQRLSAAYGFSDEMSQPRIVSASRFLLELRRGRVYVERIPDSILADFISENAGQLEQARELCWLKGGKLSLTRNAAFIASMFEALEAGVDPAWVERFVTVVNTGRYENEMDTAAVVLRNFLLEGKLAKKSANVNNAMEAEAIQTCLKKFIDREPCKVMPYERSMVYTKKNIE